MGYKGAHGIYSLGLYSYGLYRYGYVVMAYIEAYVVMACIVMAYVVMACIVMAYVVTACIVMALGQRTALHTESSKVVLNTYKYNPRRPPEPGCLTSV